MEIKELNITNYEKVIHAIDSNTGLNCFISVHSTKLGPALGGCRIYAYDNDETALEDVLRLSKGMTYKNSLAGLDLGGGKAVINIKNTKKTPGLFKKFGEVINSLEGTYITAEDVGTTLKDMKIIKKTSKHVASLDVGSPSPATALGVLRGIEASVDFWRNGLTPGHDLKNITVAIQGLGSVGYALAQMLHQKGAKIIATDIDFKRCEKLQKEIDIEIVMPDKIYAVKADVFAPCAMGGILNEKTIQKLKVSIICGAANNQLYNSFIDGAILHQNRIIYAPDYLVNAGGVMNVYREFGMINSDFHLAAMLDDIFYRTRQCLTQARRENKATNVIAKQMAKKRLT